MSPFVRRTLLSVILTGSVPAWAEVMLVPEVPPVALPQDPLASLEPLLPGEPAVAEGDLVTGEITEITSIDPVVNDTAAPTGADFEKVAEATQDQLSPLPRKLSFTGGLGIYHEENIFLSNADKTEDSGLQYSGRATVNITDSEKLKLNAFYGYSAVTLFEHDELNADYHDASLRSSYALDKTTIYLTGSLNFASGIDRRVGSVNDRLMSALALAVDRDLGVRTRLNAGVSYSGSDYKNLLSSKDFSARLGANYLFGTKTRLGLAFVGGSLTSEASEAPVSVAAGQQGSVSQLSIESQKALARQNAQVAKNNVKLARSNAALRARELRDAELNLTLETIDQATFDQAKANAEAANAAVEASESQAASVAKVTKQEVRRSSKTPDQVYYQALMTAQYEATGKLQLMGSAGMDMRKYSGPEAADASTDFTYSLTAGYQLRPKTKLSLSAQRSTVGAITLQGASIDRSLFNLEAEQKIGEKLIFTYTGGYEIDAYQSIRTDVQTDRTDRNWRHRLQLDYTLTKHVGLRAFYEMDINDSAEKVLTYDNNRYGLQVGISF